MPAKPQWLLRIPQIRAEVSALAVPVVDRAVIERVFRVRRRRAIELMHGFGGYQAGRTFLVDREHLLAHLAAIEAGDEYVRETSRRERLAARVDRMRRLHVGKAVRIAADPQTLSMRVPTLDRSIHLQPGRLEIEFGGTEDLLTKLLALGQAAANDYERFEALTNSAR